MPSGLVEDENGVGAGSDLGGDLIEMKLHGLGVASRQYEGGAGAALRTYCAEAIGEFVLLADPHLVLEPHLYRCARREFRADFRHADCEVFLNASMASPSCL